MIMMLGSICDSTTGYLNAGYASLLDESQGERMRYELAIDFLGNLADVHETEHDDLSGVQWRERSKELHRAGSVSIPNITRRRELGYLGESSKSSRM